MAFRTEPGRSAARFPQGRIGFAVGDIHGRADLLARMFDEIEKLAPAPHAAAPVVVFLGDYVDRGPDSAEVLALLLQTGRPEGFERRFLKGNHEQALLAFLDDPVRARDWLLHGGQETLVSYGVAPPPWGAGQTVLQAAAAKFLEALPARHLDFLRALEPSFVAGDYLFAHAGVDPAKPADAQSERDLCWIRRRFLEDKRAYTHVVVHGHTPCATPYRDHRRIGLDTGAYASGQLSAARFEGEDVVLFTVAAP
ncbi:MAG: metallophosphoesterase [Hyphomonadaceae bacterium]